jgi:vacuolar-type H+-ATPase subunit H
MTTGELIEKLETQIKNLKEEKQTVLKVAREISAHKKKVIEAYDDLMKSNNELISAQKTQIKALEEEISLCKEILIRRFIAQKIKLGDLPCESMATSMVKEMLLKAPLDFILSELRVLEKRLIEYKVMQRIKTSKDFTWSRTHKFF